MGETIPVKALKLTDKFLVYVDYFSFGDVVCNVNVRAFQ